MLKDFARHAIVKVAPAQCGLAHCGSGSRAGMYGRLADFATLAGLIRKGDQVSWIAVCLPDRQLCQSQSSSMCSKTSVLILSQYTAESRQTCILPFLYHTRTLLSGLPVESQYSAQRKSTRDQKCFTSSKNAQKSYEPLQQHPEFRRSGRSEPSQSRVWWSPASVQDHKVEEKRLQWSSTAEEEPQDPEPFKHAARGTFETHQASHIEEEKPRTTTITASEQAVFDRILSEISQNAPSRAEKEEDEEELEQDYLETESAEEEDVPGDPRDQLANIFELAIAKRKEQELNVTEDGPEGSTRFDEYSYAKAAELSSDSLGSATISQGSPLNRLNLEQALHGAYEEPEGNVNRAIEDHKQLVDSMLEAATSDGEIWAILQKEVFSLMSTLNLQIKLEERARRADLKRPQKAAKGTDSGGEKPNEASKTASPPPTATTNTRKPVLTLSTTNESIALTTNTLLSILQANYAHYCLYALRLFRDRGLISPYALNLLPHLKSLGPVSYVLGASTALYNEILYQKWIQFSDVQGLADLMEEMVNQGISPNITTVEFLRFVDRCRRQDLYGKNGGAKRTWWSLRPVKEGWRRIKDLYVRFMGEIGETARSDMDAMRRERRSLVKRVALNLVRRTFQNKQPSMRKVQSSVIGRLAAMPPPEHGEQLAEADRPPYTRARLRDDTLAWRSSPAATQDGSTLRDWE